MTGIDCRQFSRERRNRNLANFVGATKKPGRPRLELSFVRCSLSAHGGDEVITKSADGNDDVPSFVWFSGEVTQLFSNDIHRLRSFDPNANGVRSDPHDRNCNVITDEDSLAASQQATNEYGHGQNLSCGNEIGRRSFAGHNGTHFGSDRRSAATNLNDRH